MTIPGLIEEQHLETLRASFSGTVLSPQDDGYDDTRRIHNGLIDKHPALIARCPNTADVVDAVNFGRQEGLEISVRGGGHNVAGRAVTDGGLMIDLSAMKGIHVDPKRGTVRAQAGVTWNELNRATAAFGLATTGGEVSTTGIAGLTLGGGRGWLMGKYGMAMDNLLSAEVVLASGEVVTASEDSEPDLFWALRGGGGNFGVVTWFEYRVHPVSTVLGGPVLHPLATGAETLRSYRDLSADIPDELTTLFVFLHAPDGSGAKVCGPGLCHVGDDAGRAEADARPFREFGTPIADQVERMPYPVLNTLLDAVFPSGTLNYWKGAELAELSDAAVDVMVSAFESSPTEMCALSVEQSHGAVTRVPATATAFPHREPGYSFLVLSQWTDPDETDACISWARDTFEALRPHMAAGVYVNYLSADEDDRVRQAYGPNYDRLAEIKRRYDPDNLFRLNMNINPGALEPS
jgi:FAD/FMN-containing dehydrogenase